MIKLFLCNCLVVVIPMLVLSSLAGAQDEDQSVRTPAPSTGFFGEMAKPHVGLLAGVTDAEGGYDAGAEYGLDIGYEPIAPLGLGLELSSGNSELDEAGQDIDLQRTKLLAKANYNFGGTIPVIRESYVGLGIGPMLESIAGSDRVYLGVMPQAGFDIPLSSRASKYLSAGLNARYLISSSGNPDAFAFNGQLKYWF